MERKDWVYKGKGAQGSLPTAHRESTDRHPLPGFQLTSPRAPCTSTMSSHRGASCRHACQGGGFLGHSCAHWFPLLLPPGLPHGSPHSQGRPQNVAGFQSHTRLSTVSSRAEGAV